MGDNKVKKPYVFGGIQVFDLAQIEQEVLNDSVYLDVFAGSDPLFKTNVKPVDSSLISQNLLNLKSYHFDYKTEQFKDKKLSSAPQLGLMADEVEKVFPTMVTRDEEGYRYVNYSMMVVPLLETIKQLEQRIVQLEKKLSEK